MTLDEALEDVRIAGLQIEFAIKLLSYSECGRICPAQFDSHELITLPEGNLVFPPGNFSVQEDVVRAAGVAVSLAFAGMALALDTARDSAGVPIQRT